MPRPSRRITLAAVCAVLFAVAFAGVALAQSNDKLRAGETVTMRTVRSSTTQASRRPSCKSCTAK